MRTFQSVKNTYKLHICEGIYIRNKIYVLYACILLTFRFLAFMSGVTPGNDQL